MQNNDPLSTSESQAAPTVPEHAQAPTPSQDMSVAFITKQQNEGKFY